MKTIKIFLASSEELSNDRNAFGNLVRRLDRMYEKRGLRIDLFEWEDYDAAYNVRRKQNEYNDEIKKSDMFLALFHIKAGEGTIEEFDVATEEFRKHASPKIYVYCKELKPEEQESQELKEFKRKLTKDFGHYWCRYGNRDSMQLHFVMQLQLVETNGIVDKLKAEDGLVLLETMPIAKMDNLQFAAGNTTYQRMSSELAEMPEQIKKARERAAKYPKDVDLQDELQQKLNNYNKLKDEFAQIQNALLETALHITVLQQGRVSEMLRRAIDAFDVGNLEKANILLDEIALEAEQHMKQLDKQRELVHQDIDAFRVQAKTVMADGSIPIDDRIQKTFSIYAKADEWAKKSALPNEKYEELLDEYGSFLFDYGKYAKALEISLRLLDIRENLYGFGHVETALSLGNIGAIYHSQSCYNKALDYYHKALSIQIRVFGEEHADVATSYNNIGVVNEIIDNDIKALKYHQKALKINKKVLGIKHPNTATSYNNIGVIYSKHEDYKKALENYTQALNIRLETLGIEHPDTATSYNNIGVIYAKQEDYEKAFENFMQVLNIRLETLGREHPKTASSYHNIGSLFELQGLFDKALEYHLRALSIFEKIYGIEHIETAKSYDNVGKVYSGLKDYPLALKYHLKAVDIFERVLGIDNLSSAIAYHNVGMIYYVMNNQAKALDFFLKALSIYEKKIGNKHSYTKDVKKMVETINKPT